jgi:hypothetical protein
LNAVSPVQEPPHCCPDELHTPVDPEQPQCPVLQSPEPHAPLNVPDATHVPEQQNVAQPGSEPAAIGVHEPGEPPLHV